MNIQIAFFWLAPELALGCTERWVKVPKCALPITFLSSNSLHKHGGKNNCAHVTTQRILNKFTELNFSVGCMVWLCDAVYSKIRPPVKVLMRWTFLIDQSLNWHFSHSFSRKSIIGKKNLNWPMLSGFALSVLKKFWISIYGISNLCSLEMFDITLVKTMCHDYCLVWS